MRSALHEPDLPRLLERLADEMPIPMQVPPRALRRARKKLWRNVVASVALASLVLAGSVSGVRAILRSAPAPQPADTPTQAPAPDGWTRIESSLHGYSIEVPADWTSEPATVTWDFGENSLEDGRADVWYAPNGTGLRITSQPVPAGMTEAEWLDRADLRRWVDERASCVVRTTAPIEVDGVAGVLTQNCLADVPEWKGNDALEVAVVADGRGYTVWFQSLGDFDPQRRLLMQILASMDLRPEEGQGEPAEASAWRGIWPQATLGEAEEAQARADQGDRAVAWQLDPGEGGAEEVAKRFVREYLGWEGSQVVSGITLGPVDSETGWGSIASWPFVRCEREGTNAAYPDEDCAPASGNTFPHVVVRLEQLLRPDPTGIWIVTRVAELPAYEQAVPLTPEQTREVVASFLEARLVGDGAEAFGHPEGEPLDLPLMYATSAGAPFEAFEIADVGPASWPSGVREVSFRLFAEAGATTVEQSVMVAPGGGWSGTEGTLSGAYGPWIFDAWGVATTENGEVIDVGTS